MDHKPIDISRVRVSSDTQGCDTEEPSKPSSPAIIIDNNTGPPGTTQDSKADKDGLIIEKRTCRCVGKMESVIVEGQEEEERKHVNEDSILLQEACPRESFTMLPEQHDEEHYFGKDLKRKLYGGGQKYEGDECEAKTPGISYTIETDGEKERITNIEESSNGDRKKKDTRKLFYDLQEDFHSVYSKNNGDDAYRFQTRSTRRQSCTDTDDFPISKFDQDGESMCMLSAKPCEDKTDFQGDSNIDEGNNNINFHTFIEDDNIKNQNSSNNEHIHKTLSISDIVNAEILRHDASLSGARGYYSSLDVDLRDIYGFYDINGGYAYYRDAPQSFQQFAPEENFINSSINRSYDINNIDIRNYQETTQHLDSSVGNMIWIYDDTNKHDELYPKKCETIGIDSNLQKRSQSTNINRGCYCDSNYYTLLAQPVFIQNSLSTTEGKGWKNSKNVTGNRHFKSSEETDPDYICSSGEYSDSFYKHVYRENEQLPMGNIYAYISPLEKHENISARGPTKEMNSGEIISTLDPPNLIQEGSPSLSSAPSPVFPPPNRKKIPDTRTLEYNCTVEIPMNDSGDIKKSLMSFDKYDNNSVNNNNPIVAEFCQGKNTNRIEGDENKPVNNNNDYKSGTVIQKNPDDHSKINGVSSEAKEKQEQSQYSAGGSHKHSHKPFTPEDNILIIQTFMNAQLKAQSKLREKGQMGSNILNDTTVAIGSNKTIQDENGRVCDTKQDNNSILNGETVLHPSPENEYSFSSTPMPSPNTLQNLSESLPTPHSPSSIVSHYRRILDPRIRKGHWTQTEDHLLVQAVKNWCIKTGSIDLSVVDECKKTSENTNPYTEGVFVPPSIAKAKHIDWRAVSKGVKGRTEIQVRDRWKRLLGKGGCAKRGEVAKRSKRGRWTREEDEKLRQAVAKHGAGNWVAVASEVEGRSDQQCLRHWEKVLNPAIRKGRFTEAEDKALLAAVELYGEGRWAAVARYVPNRTDKQVHLRYATLMGTGKTKRGNSH